VNSSEEFSDRLKTLMAERQLTMSELARLLHTQASTLSRWFNGSIPQRNTLKALCEVLKVNELWLAKGRGPRDQTTPPATPSAADFSGYLREDPVDALSSSDAGDVKLLVSALQEMAESLTEHPLPKFSTLIGMRSLIGELLPYLKPAQTHEPHRPQP